MTQTAPRPRTATLFKSWSAVDHAAHGLLSPIATEEHHAQALQVIDELMIEIGNAPGHPLLSLLRLLSEHVEAFESAAYPAESVPPHRVLSFLMEERGLSQKQLEAETGIDQSNLSKILKGARALNVAQIKVLSGYFHVSPEVFLA